MTIVIDHATSLTGSGFTEAQAAAIDRAVHASTHEAVEVLGAKLARWHAYLAMFLLIEIGIVVLAVLMVQAVREPVYPTRAALVGDIRSSSSAPQCSDSW